MARRAKTQMALAQHHLLGGRITPAEFRQIVRDDAWISGNLLWYPADPAWGWWARELRPSQQPPAALPSGKTE